MKIEEMLFPHDGRMVHAVAYWPDASGRTPAVILSHGYGGTAAGAKPQAEYLAERGIAAVCLTLCGGSNADPSGFPTTKMSLITERDDILAAAAQLGQDKRVDADRIVLYGESQGGMASVLAAAERPDAVAALALLYPALCIPDDWRARLRNDEDVPEELEFWGMKLGRAFFDSARQLHTFDVLPRYQGHVLILHGEQDKIVDAAYAKRAAALYEHCELHLYPAEGHGFSREGVQSVCERLYAFVQHTVG